ncbi:hypothetical protein L3V79_04585 [Thiotrichales bacterium 19S9-12]|nr:hypothetical protein [Thiotrichales bacterium 19S9-11]MCF6811636.1 hypothetical protein [Thiotrichales bacterium 19S9-12]
MQEALFYPVFVLMIFTFISMFISLFSKVQAIRDGSIPLADINQLEYSQATSESHHAKTAAYHFYDLNRLPFIFYINTIILCLLQTDHTIFLILSWLYVSVTILHSIIYVTYNNFIHRLSVYLIANSFLFVMVILALIEMIKN